jgi:hypothetical protein
MRLLSNPRAPQLAPVDHVADRLLIQVYEANHAGSRRPAVMLPNLIWSRGLLALAAAATFVATASGALGSTSRGGPLTGTWSGVIAGSGVQRQHILIVVNAEQNGGSWKLSATCHGPLTLDSISSRYHHYLRKLAHGSTCAGGDIDCLRRVGANVYDAVTSHRGGEYDQSGTLHRVLAK